MKQISAFALVALLTLPGAPVAAQDTTDPEEVEEGLDLLGEGLKLLLDGLGAEVEGLAEELEPKLRQLAEQAGPALQQLLDLVDDFNAYHPPERLPNGDIIIRRKSPAEIAPQDGGEVDI